MPGGGALILAARREDDAFEIEVRDQGPGIPPEIRDKIFNLYFTTKKSGSGIGLAMSYRVMQLHNGSVEFVACPHLPDNTKGVSELSHIKIHQSVVGSCTNGRIEDLRIAAKVLKGHTVHPDVRMIIIPATQAIYKQAMKEGLFDVFIDAQAAVSTPTCGPCLGGHMGILAKGERSIATTNRNFVGRMGHPESEVYLSNPAIAAASAVLGRIGSPDEMK